MKVSLGMNLQPGPWGGGNQFGRALVEYLRARGVEVSFDLKARDLDLILLAEPRSNLRISAYTDREIIRYLLIRNWRALVVHRVNECDERKGTTDTNRTLIRANACADYTVFVSAWLRDLLMSRGLPCQNCRAILNGSDRKIFNSEGYRRWDREMPLRLVTHHWGGHWMKGFDIYECLDELLDANSFEHELSFTYIGNLPEGFRFRNATHVKPTFGADLADAIRQHHVYVTASRNEPGPNHQNEGANCGLPLLYRESGALPEYCDGFGISFTAQNFEQKLQEMIDTYDHWADRMKDYPHTAERTCEQYYQLFTELLDQREEFLTRRRWQRQAPLLMRALVPRLPRRAQRVLRWLKKLSGFKN